MKVLKFGGTSVGSAKKLTTVANIVQKEKPVWVVLSAMSGTTDNLTEIINIASNDEKDKAREKILYLKDFYISTIKSLPGFSSDAARIYIEILFNGILEKINQLPQLRAKNEILATGEKFSTFIFHQMLIQQGTKALLIDATTLIHINENGEPDTSMLKNRLQYIRKHYPNTQVFVTQGFICSNTKKETDNLGRGGSDYTASLIGAALDAEEIQIWTDIDGIQNNDPRIVSNTQPIRQLRFDEAAELAYFGAKILHPLTIQPAKQANIPVLLKNTLHPEDIGTRITAQYDGKGFKAVAARDGITAIRIHSSNMLMAYGFMRKVFEVFEKFQTSIDMVTTSEVAVSITIDNDTHLSEIVKELQPYGTVKIERNKTIVGVVGLIRANEPGYAHQLFNALDDIPIRMISYGASRYNFSLLVNTEDKERTLRALNRRLFHNDPVIFEKQSEKQIEYDYSQPLTNNL